LEVTGPAIDGPWYEFDIDGAAAGAVETIAEPAGAISVWLNDGLVGQDPDVVLSGDVAADRVRPWRVPSVAVVYGGLDEQVMDELGFVPADSLAAASIVVRPVPDDHFRAQAHRVDGLLLAPWLHLVADLLGLGGDDRADAAARFAELGTTTPT
jgi:hypothetical protein